MRDIEEQMAHEAEQQELVHDVLSRLHRSAEDNYLTYFGSVATVCMSALLADNCLTELATSDPEAAVLIGEPIVSFAADEIERKLLLSLVTKKLIEPVLGQYQSNYLRATIAAQAAHH